MFSKLDFHHHLVPPYYKKFIEDHGGDPSGWKIPDWSPELDLEATKALGIKKSFLSITTPGVEIANDIKVAREVTRNLNLYQEDLVSQHPGKFGSFASLPPLWDVEGVLKEIQFCVENLKIDGFVVFTSYSDGQKRYYLGAPEFEPIWTKLNELGAIVFVHPTYGDEKMINGRLPSPLIDYPHQTTRTACDLVSSGTKRKFSEIDFILSHAGGTLTIMGARALYGAKLGLWAHNEQESLEDFKSFYYDIALSGSFVPALYEFADPSRIVFGSDFPYVPVEASAANADAVAGQMFSAKFQNLGESQYDQLCHKNGERLLENNKLRSQIFGKK